MQAILQRHLSAVPGWVGGDRMRKKTSTVNRQATPFGGTHEDLERIIQGMLQVYNSEAQGGHLKGLSPYGALERAIGNGWQMTAVDDTAFAFAFSEPVVRNLHQGAFMHANQRWTCDQLATHLEDRVEVLIPKYERDVQKIVVNKMDRTFLGIAEPAPVFSYLDPAGAVEAGRLQKLKIKAVKSAIASVPKVDRLQERLKLAASSQPEPKAPVGGIVSGNQQAVIALQKFNETPVQRRTNRLDDVRRADAEAQDAMAELHARLIGGKP